MCIYIHKGREHLFSRVTTFIHHSITTLVSSGTPSHLYNSINGLYPINITVAPVTAYYILLYDSV